MPDHSPLSSGFEKPGIPELTPQVTKPLDFTSASVAADAADAAPKIAAPMAADRIAFFIFSQPLFLIRHQKKAVYLVVYEQLPASPPGALIYHNRNCRHGQVLPSRIVSKKRNFSKNVLFMGNCLINTLKEIKNCSGCQADRLNLRV
jgi:hypothetical protein